MNPKDAGHERASGWLNRVRTGIVTTEWILLEVADAMSDPKNRGETADFICVLRADPGVAILGYERDFHEGGFALYASRSDKSWSLTDCISFVAMKNEGISEALTGDRHFEQAGFIALLK